MLPLSFVIPRLQESSSTQNGLALVILSGMGRELLEPSLWHAVDSRSICFCPMSSPCKGATAPLYIWGTPPTSCGLGRAVNHSAPDSPRPLLRVRHMTKLAKCHAPLHTGREPRYGPLTSAGPSPSPEFSQLDLEELELVPYYPLACRVVKTEAPGWMWPLIQPRREGQCVMWEWSQAEMEAGEKERERPGPEALVPSLPSGYPSLPGSVN